MPDKTKVEVRQCRTCKSKEGPMEIHVHGEGNYHLCVLCEVIDATEYELSTHREWVEKSIAFCEFTEAVVELLRTAGINPKRMRKLGSDDLSIYPADRLQARDIRHALRTIVDKPEKWNRKLDILDEERMQYWNVATWNDGEKKNVFEIYLRSVVPPESCKIVYDEHRVPSRVERRPRLICGPEEE